MVSGGSQESVWRGSKDTLRVSGRCIDVVLGLMSVKVPNITFESNFFTQYFPNTTSLSFILTKVLEAQPPKT